MNNKKSTTFEHSLLYKDTFLKPCFSNIFHEADDTYSNGFSSEENV